MIICLTVGLGDMSRKSQEVGAAGDYNPSIRAADAAVQICFSKSSIFPPMMHPMLPGQ